MTVEKLGYIFSLANHYANTNIFVEWNLYEQGRLVIKSQVATNVITPKQETIKNCNKLAIKLQEKNSVNTSVTNNRTTRQWTALQDCPNVVFVAVINNFLSCASYDINCLTSGCCSIEIKVIAHICR